MSYRMIGRLAMLREQNGAVLVETAIGLAIALIIVMFLLWVGLVFHFKRSLNTAVHKGIRLAITRSDPALVGGHLIAPLEAFIQHGVVSERFKVLMSNNVEWSDARWTLNNIVTQSFRSAELEDLPPVYLYALVYINEGMKLSVGSNIRYPCDPSQDNPDGLGCMLCRFVNPDTGEVQGPSNPPRFDDGSNPIPDQPLGINCEINPAPYIIKPVYQLFGLLLGPQATPRFNIEATSHTG
ncbi:MAG: pilus assembly protein [Bdellovibrionales bacterium]|nr:pilus assembly protein [Bdellovibrionales bacterium]